jgi:hypothetical protein
MGGYSVGMAQEANQEQVLEAARSLDRAEGFTREEVAGALGVEISEMRPSWKAAKEAGKIQRVSSKGGKRLFRLANQ